MSGHGHVTPNADGSKARCGGPKMCSVCALEYAQVHGGAMQVPVAAEPKSEIQRLREEVEFLKSCGVVELAIRNPSVADYMRHWESRAEAAEAKLATILSASKAYFDGYCQDEADDADNCFYGLHQYEAVKALEAAISKAEGRS